MDRMTIVLWSLCMVLGVAGVLEAFPYQQGLDGTSKTSEQQRDLQGNVYARRTESFKPTPSQYYECYGTSICETGVHFCSENRRTCEKCSDYQAACGTNLQHFNCTQYCMKFLMEGKCNETVITKPSLTPTEKTLDYTQKTNSSALTNNPETCFHWKWICVTSSLGIALAASLSCNVYQHCHGKQAKQTESTDDEQTGLLKDRLTDVLVDTPISLEFISDQNSGACPTEDESSCRSLTPSAPFIREENLHQDETSIKLNSKCLPCREPANEEPNQCRERHVGPRGIMDELRGPAEDTDIQTSSGCSSASSTLSRNSSGVTSKTTININIHNGQTGLSTTSTETTKNAIQPENPRKEVPYGVEETDANFNHGKLVSDDDQNGRLALPEISVGIDDLTKASFKGCLNPQYSMQHQ